MTEIAKPDPNIWTPNQGMVPPGWTEANKAVQDYDPSLSLGRRDDGEWIVHKQRSAGEPPFPVLSLGKLPAAPTRDFITEHLHKGDVRRNGTRILAAVARANERKRTEAAQAASEAAEEWATYAEFHTRGERG